MEFLRKNESVETGRSCPTHAFTLHRVSQSEPLQSYKRRSSALMKFEPKSLHLWLRFGGSTPTTRTWCPSSVDGRAISKPPHAATYIPQDWLVSSCSLPGEISTTLGSYWTATEHWMTCSRLSFSPQLYVACCASAATRCRAYEKCEHTRRNLRRT